MITSMIKKYGLWYVLKKFHILGFFIAALLLTIFQKPLIFLCCFLLRTSTRDTFIYGTIKEFFPFVTYGLLGVLFYTNYQAQSYRYQTGRDHHYDRSHYHRTSGELIDYFKDSEPHRLDSAAMFPIKHWKDAAGIIFGKDNGRLVSIPSDSECNVAVFGPPGSGKTSGIAITTAMQFSGSVLAIDIKGDIYNYVSKNSDRKILRFAPDHPDALRVSCKFDPLQRIHSMDMTDKKLYLKNMAIILIPSEGGDAGEYFTKTARKLFQGITWLMLHENPETSFPDIVHAILKGNVFEWVKKSLDSDCEQAKECIASLYGNNEKNVSGSYDTLTSALLDFSNPVLDVLLSKGDNSVSTERLDEGYDIYLQIRQEHLAAYAPLFTLLIQSLSQEFMNRLDSSGGVKNRPILMLLDEFPQLSFSYSMINTNLSTLRSKSVICMLIQQNLSQLDHRYRNEGTRSILGNCNFQLILGSNDIVSSKYFSDTFGLKKILKVSNSFSSGAKVSTGRTVQEADTKVFPPEYFGDLSERAVLYFKGKYVEMKKINCYKDL